MQKAGNLVRHNRLNRQKRFENYDQINSGSHGSSDKTDIIDAEYTGKLVLTETSLTAQKNNPKELFYLFLMLYEVKDQCLPLLGSVINA